MKILTGITIGMTFVLTCIGLLPQRAATYAYEDGQGVIRAKLPDSSTMTLTPSGYISINDGQEVREYKPGKVDNGFLTNWGPIRFNHITRKVSYEGLPNLRMLPILSPTPHIPRSLPNNKGAAWGITNHSVRVELDSIDDYVRIYKNNNTSGLPDYMIKADSIVIDSISYAYSYGRTLARIIGHKAIYRLAAVPQVYMHE